MSALAFAGALALALAVIDLTAYGFLALMRLFTAVAQ